MQGIETGMLAFEHRRKVTTPAGLDEEGLLAAIGQSGR